ncbi:MAG: site-specific integrase [Oscillospiraceae bacterium]|nr:site-specific integrase [Oscillospiraceae bacterium]
MASIVQRKNSFCVVYNYTDENGKRKQKWESYHSMAEAKKRKKEIEYRQEIGTFVVPQCKTVKELLKEYVALYGKTTWALSTYQGNMALIDHYIVPVLGDMKLADVNTRVIEKYYQQLLKMKAVPSMIYGKKDEKHETKYITPHTVREIHKILRNCFAQAVKWDLMEKNPCVNATVPKVEHKKREIWTAETLFHAMELCEDDRLKLAMNLAFACSLRLGELLGLTWDCVDISEESIANGTAHIFINKEIQRVSREAMESLDRKDVIMVFPSISSKTTTVQVLKTPKTASSVRKIFLPKTVAEMLIEWKRSQDFTREALGDEYHDYNLVFAGPLGMPTEGATIRASMKKLIQDNDLPPVVFHSLRHSSITYKLKLNGGNIKAVQGDSGHSQAQMVTDQYSHIIDEDRAHNAQLFEETFYSGKGREPEVPQAAPQSALPGNIDPELLNKVLQSPELVALLQMLGQNKS